MNKKNTPIKVAFYCHRIRYGGIERVISLLINFLSENKFFIIYLITVSGILKNEYSIPINVKRITLSNHKMNIYKAITKENIDVLIYSNYYLKEEIKKLNELNITKVIYYNHSAFIYWIYSGIYKFENTIYPTYKNCEYVISLIPLENDYLFKMWGINSILMDNPSTFDYDLVIPSDLSKKNIIMIGRSDDFVKRFELGIYAMKTILNEFPECKMNIISIPKRKLKNLIKALNLEKNVKITGFKKNPEPYLKNASLHIFPSISESYSMVLGEAKIFGIPSILCGIDYISLAKGGTIIIYDDNPDTISKEAIKILKEDKYRIKLGKEARKSMQKHKNMLITKKWIKLILSVYNGIDSASIMKYIMNDYKPMTKVEIDRILNNQLNLLKKRKPNFKDLTLENLKLYSLE